LIGVIFGVVYLVILGHAIQQIDDDQDSHAGYDDQLVCIVIVDGIAHCLGQQTCSMTVEIVQLKTTISYVQTFRNDADT
jgi:hypothetical protein